MGSKHVVAYISTSVNAGEMRAIRKHLQWPRRIYAPDPRMPIAFY